MLKISGLPCFDRACSKTSTQNARENQSSTTGQQSPQHPGAREGKLQMQLVQTPHQREIRLRHRPRQVVDAAAADIQKAQPAWLSEDRDRGRSASCAQPPRLGERSLEKNQLIPHIENSASIAARF